MKKFYIISRKNIKDILYSRKNKELIKNINIIEMQEIIQKKLNNPNYQTLYTRYQELSKKLKNNKIITQELFEFAMVLEKMREYEKAMFFSEFGIIY